MVRRHPIKETRSPSDYSLDFEEITFQSEDKVSLRGFWIPCQGSKRVVILLHGFAGSLDPDIRYTPHLHAAGFNVLMFDFRAHGRSSGRVTSMGALEARDVRAAVRFANNKGCDRVGLLGFSMGGRAALLAAPSIPSLKAIVSDGAPPRQITAVTQNLSLRGYSKPLNWLIAHMMLIGASILTGSNLFQTNPLSKNEVFPSIPVLFFHGEKDRYATRQELNRMVENAGAHAQLWLVPEARHRNIEETRPDEYQQKMIEFFTANL